MSTTAPIDASLQSSPLVFISHDTRDANLAEAFSRLLKSVSAGMLKTFRSSDKKGTEGIEFGDEWYKALMAKLDVASDVVCLLTERSVSRPWLLYEAGVAKGKMGTPVHGLALGVSLAEAGSGPFYQFQNSDESPESVAKLVVQLCKRIPGLDPDHEVIESQVKVFLASANSTLQALDASIKAPVKASAPDSASAKILEEMKLVVRELPMLMERYTYEFADRSRMRSVKRLPREIFFELFSRFRQNHGTNNLPFLLMAGLLRDEYPWLYEVWMEVARAVGAKASLATRKDAVRKLQESIEFTLSTPILEVSGHLNKDNVRFLRELPMMVEDILMLEAKE